MCLISLRDAKFGLVFSPNNCSPLDSKLTASRGSPSSHTATLVIGGSLEIEDLITAWIGICLDVHKVHFLLHVCVWKYPLLMWFLLQKTQVLSLSQWSYPLLRSVELCPSCVATCLPWNQQQFSGSLFLELLYYWQNHLVFYHKIRASKYKRWWSQLPRTPMF